MRVVVTGATGFIGRALVRELRTRGDTVIALTRSAERARATLGPEVEALDWSPPRPGPWVAAVDGVDAVVNLAGEPIESRRWTRAQKERMWSSRVDATRAVVEAIRAANRRPSVLLNQSAMGYYGPRGAEVLTEESAPGSDFLAQLVQAWEGAAKPVEDLGVRLVLPRTGVVLGRGGGALPLFVLPFRFFAGGTVGRPNAWLSWIHIADQVGATLFALDRDLHGPVNLTAPNPVTVAEFSSQIGRILGRPAWVPMMSAGIRIGLGELGESVMASQRVLPWVLESARYSFRYTDSEQALRSLLTGSRMAVPTPQNLLTAWRSRGMLEALSSLAFSDEE